MSDPQYRERKLAERKLSTNLPRANIVRIESLDGNARQRYLATVQRFGDDIRTQLLRDLHGEGDGLFFGFLTERETRFAINANWNNSNASGAILGGLKFIGQKLTKSLGLNSLVGNITEAGSHTIDIAQKIGGINSQATGSGTVKEFGSIDLDDMTIECGWYLPEQGNLCKRSLKALYRMAYPKQVDPETVSNAVGKIVKGSIDGASKLVSNESTPPSGNENPNTVNQEPAKDSADGNIIKDIVDFGTKGVELFMKLNEAFGTNYTFNPLPVRLSVGQHIDLEPLVITSVATTFSPETFIDDDGYHLPIFVKTQIRFKYWLIPAPDLQFANILNTPVFGVAAKDNGKGKYVEASGNYTGKMNEGQGIKKDEIFGANGIFENNPNKFNKQPNLGAPGFKNFKQ